MYKYQRKWQIKTGIQMVEYNQALYELKVGAPNVETVTPYADFLYKFSRKKSIRVELQYMFVGEDDSAGFKQDFGNWFFILAEYAIAPHWSFVASDMYNVSPGKNTPVDVDSGENGVCRLEPAFSGFNFSINSTF